MDDSATDEDAADLLEDLLERERRALHRGDIDAAVRLAVRKEALARRLQPAGTGAPQLARLRTAAARNAGLLVAATAGIRAAADRIRALRGMPPALATYDGQGRVTALAPAVPEVARRA